MGMDDVKIGIGCIAALGVSGLCTILYASITGPVNPDDITGFSLAVGGLIAALVRGQSGGGGA